MADLNVAKKAIIRALVEGQLTDILVKTSAEQVYLDDSTTLTAKIAEIIADLATKAKSTDVTEQINTAIAGLIDGAPETYNTLKEIAEYIEAHEEVVTALNAAIGSKADASEFNDLKESFDSLNQNFGNLTYSLGDMAYESVVSESSLDTTLADKINTAASTATRAEQTASEAYDMAHTHENSQVLAGITNEKVSSWDAKSKVFYNETQPETLQEGDLWFQLLS